ncbi:MAG: Type 1 glutamine amidotransferase-like domain-containing protein [Chloroflexi bacterium]|nr:Type 1 glutamine amidotransferase-like domain-containing protein [Chloroflexota bacterium]
MKGHIFLSGGGDREDTVVLDKKFFNLLPSGSKILYIPIALNRDAIGFAACHDWFSGCISMHSGNKDIDFRMILEDEDVPELADFNAIYIGGGNTFKLLNYIKEKKLDKRLVKYLKNGGILYGGSAGAIILGENINTVKEENDSNYEYSRGLNLVGGLSLICHYEPNLNEKIMASVNEISTPIIAMPEDSGIAIHPDSIEVVGNALIFDPERKKLLKSYLQKRLWSGK